MNKQTHEIERLADFAAAVRESTLKRLRKLPAEHYNWRPDDSAMSFSDIAHHLIEADKWLFKKIDERDIEPMKGSAGTIVVSSPEEYASLLTRLETTGRERIDLIKSLDDEKLREMVFDSRYDGEVSIWWIIVRGNLDHEIHHRGQIAAYLRIMGIT
jgi:uncharacterized damage-inducible protein DinB